jgi:hypothetical protein
VIPAQPGTTARDQGIDLGYASPQVFYERDYIKRLIRQFAEVLARLAGFRKEDQYDLALQLVEEAHRDVLGVPAQMLSRIDAASAALLLGNTWKITAYGRLLEEEAELRRLRGEEKAARQGLHRALEVYVEAALAGATDPENRAAILRLAGIVDATVLHERYRCYLDGLQVA